MFLPVRNLKEMKGSKFTTQKLVLGNQGNEKVQTKSHGVPLQSYI
jgi:hypothetical protein